MNNDIEHQNLINALDVAIMNVFHKPQQIYFTDDRNNGKTDENVSPFTVNSDEQERLKGYPPHQV